MIGLCIFAAAASASADLYPRLEASFTITNLATDPFDYTVTDVRAQILQPDSTTLSLPAFFDGGTTWRVRHSPAMPGVYQITGLTLNGQPISSASLQPSSWTVAGRPTSPGFVRIDPANTNRFITSNGRRYFPVGQDVAWDTTAATNVVGIMAKLGGARENWARVWMDAWDGKNLDWPKVGAFGQLSLTVAQKWDSIVAAADQSGVSFQMTLHHHGEYSSTVDPNWPQNPYNTANGGFLTNATQFFTNSMAKSLTKRKLRYSVARWGYSPAIMAWELFNEVQFTDAGQQGQWSMIGAWHDEMALFLRSQDLYQHLITTSSDLSQPIWNQCDYYQHHDYPTDLISNLRDAPGVPAGQPMKPIFGGECGMDPTPYLGVHGPVWAGLMGAQSGNAQPWYWDRIDAENSYNLIRPARDFVLSSGLADQNSLTKAAPHVTCSQNTALVFSPGGGWGNASQDTFTVGDVAPDGIGSLPSYLQGTYHRSMTPNGYTFAVNYPPGGGSFSAQILIIASSGAGLTLILDNTSSNSISFPAAASDQNTNYTLSISVPAGQHTVKLWNPGLDWVNLGNLTFNPYVPMLGAYQVGNSNFAAVWLWHRTNVYNLNASSSLPGSFPLTGLQPGTYSGTFWDTFAGAAISNFTFSVAGTNAATINTPPILRSMAFFAGKAPQANVVAPLLTQTLGSNSPPLVLPLVLTNGGGLPLSYSLSVTGVNPVAYGALTSAQTGGPAFAWKDISAVGRDLTTNFTALASPKTAGDEGIAGPVDLGFAFPFFSGAQTPGVFTQIYVSPNGFVTFNPFTGDTSTNRSLPNALAPTNLIAFVWRDLDIGSTGRVYCLSDTIAGAFTLQFQNVTIKGGSGSVTCQLILKSSGEILAQYKSLGSSNACTVGLQNAAAGQALQLAYNQSYLQSNFALRLNAAPWLDLASNAGLAPGAAADSIALALNPAGLAYGNYTATILAETGDPAQSLFVLPVLLQVTPIATWRQSHFGTAANSGNAADTADPDHDGLINIFEYAFGTDPLSPSPNPISVAVSNAHLVVTFKRPHPAPADISYLFEVSDDIASGLWHSGPGYTTQTVLNNGDGTETVTVTDLTAIGATAAHYLRVRISQP